MKWFMFFFIDSIRLKNFHSAACSQVDLYLHSQFVLYHDSGTEDLEKTNYYCILLVCIIFEIHVKISENSKTEIVRTNYLCLPKFFKFM